MRNHEERLLRQREYYRLHREEILRRNHTGENRYIRSYEYIEFTRT